MPRLPKLGFGDINDGSTEGYGIKRDRARFDFPLIGQSQPHRTPKSPGCSGAVASTWPSKRRGVGASRPQTGIRKRNAWRSFRAVTGEGGLEISRPSGRKRRRTGRRRYGIRSARSEGLHLEYPEYSPRGGTNDDKSSNSGAVRPRTDLQSPARSLTPGNRGGRSDAKWRHDQEQGNSHNPPTTIRLASSARGRQ
jgi:hypothetical protein